MRNAASPAPHSNSAAPLPYHPRRSLIPRCLSALAFLAALAAASILLRGQDDWSRRDAWQRPAEVMDALGLKPGSVVADVGCGGGYFTFHLAARVGPNGRVYAEDIQENELKKIHDRASREKLQQIETIHGTESDPHLPAGALDAILVVNAYHEMIRFDPMMSAFFRALKPGALLAIIDAQDAPGQPRKDYQDRHTLPAQLVREDAARAGFHFERELAGFHSPDRDRDFYFLLLSKPAPPA